MATLTARDIVRLFEEDEEARKRLAELLVSEPGVGPTMASAVLSGVATKRDLENVRTGLKTEIERVREELRADIERVWSEVGGLRERLARLDGRVDLLVKVFVGFNVAILVTLVAALVR